MGQRTFWTVWFGQLVSQVGSSMTGFAMTIYVFQDTGSVTALGVMLLAVNLPAVVLGPLAGVVVDRVNRRTVMLLSDSAAAVGTLSLAALFFADALSYWQIVVVAAVLSSAGAFQDPAYRAAVPTLVDKDRLGRANGLIELAPAVGTLAAPAIAGAVLLSFGVGAVLAVDFATFLVAAGTLVLVRFPDVERTEERASTWVEFRSGLRYLQARRGLMWLLGIVLGLNLVLTFANVLWVPAFLSFANEAQLGGMLSIGGIAMVVGSLAMSAWGGPKRRIRGMLLMMGVAASGVVLSGLRPSVVTATLGMVVLMGFLPLINGTSQTLWQTKVELPMQGRVFSARRMAAQAATPIAFLGAGPLADGVFEPLLAVDGPLAASIGSVWGVGDGRGSAFLISCAGFATIALAMTAWLIPSIRNLETEVPDAIPDEAVAVG